MNNPHSTGTGINLNQIIHTIIHKHARGTHIPGTAWILIKEKSNTATVHTLLKSLVETALGLIDA